MRQLKYLRLFEAIESIILTKTLAYLPKESKEKFLRDLKLIANKIDLPLSKYSDEYFQYLSLDEALEKNMSVIDEPCDAKSDEQIPQYGISGETCKGGKLKRRWGSGTREVSCPVCKGSGVKPKKLTEIKWIKWWFDKNGKYVGVTATDGNIRNQMQLSNLVDVSNITETSENIEDYQVIETIRNSRDLKKLKLGTFIKATVDRKSVIGRVWNDGSRVYLIQNRADGGSPSGSNWQKYGRYSWVISNGEYAGYPQVLFPNSLLEKDEIEKVDPYSWNAPVDLKYGTLQNDSDVKIQLSEANFGIILDFLELKKSGFKTVQDISAEREESKVGATALMNDEEIKQQNLERYFREASKKIQIDTQLTNINGIIDRFFGFSKLGFKVLSGQDTRDFNYFISDLYKFVKGEDREHYYSRMIDKLTYKTERNAEYNRNVEMVLNKLSQSENNKLIIDKLKEINAMLCGKFKSFKVENIEDMEIILQKMKSIRNIFDDSDRFSNFEYISDFSEYLNDEYRAGRYLDRALSYSQIEDILADLDRFKRIVEKI